MCIQICIQRGSICGWKSVHGWCNQTLLKESATFVKIHRRVIPWAWHLTVDTLRPRQDGRYFADDVLKCIFLNENVWILLKMSLKFVPKDPINNIPALVQIMAWCRPDDKPLSEPILVFVPTHICVTRPQWGKSAIIHSGGNWGGFPVQYSHMENFLGGGGTIEQRLNILSEIVHYAYLNM